MNCEDKLENGMCDHNERRVQYPDLCVNTECPKPTTHYKKGKCIDCGKDLECNSFGKDGEKRCYGCHIRVSE